jgi:hypothetical protein
MSYVAAIGAVGTIAGGAMSGGTAPMPGDVFTGAPIQFGSVAFKSRDSANQANRLESTGAPSPFAPAPSYSADSAPASAAWMPWALGAAALVALVVLLFPRRK